MPQPPTPNMGLVRPTDHGDGDVWDVLLDAMFLAIDAHNHAPGAGAKLQLSTINPDADFPMFDVAGNKRAFTGLKAVAFAQVPPAINTSIFVADGSAGTVAGELYWRTSVGGNVQVTQGAALNINAFTGGIGGDYNGVGALESYVDALDAYLFQQQTGAGVRQFAKQRTSDIAFFEFLAVGVSPAPTNSVTIKAPAGLANTFQLTLPGALPSGPIPLQVDATGVIGFIGQEPHAAGEAVFVAGIGYTFTKANGVTGEFIDLGVGTQEILCPVNLTAGRVATSWSVFFNKATSGATTLTAKLWDKNMSTNARTQLATASNNANAPGAISIGTSGTFTLASNHVFEIETAGGGVATGDKLLGWQIG